MARLRTDVVTIRFRRERITGRRIITDFLIIGSAVPCRRFIVIGRRVIFAERCLLTNGFRLISSGRNVLVFERRRT